MTIMKSADPASQRLHIEFFNVREEDNLDVDIKFMHSFRTLFTVHVI